MNATIDAGDCLRWMKRIEARSVGLVCADPPYSEHTHSKSKAAAFKGARNPTGARAERKTPRARDLGFASLTPALARGYAEHAARIATRWVLTFSDEQNIGLWRGLLEDVDLEVVRVCPWVKPNSSPQFSGDRPGAGWEAIIVAHQTRSRGRPVKKRWNGGGHRGVFTYDVPRAGRIHTTEKPAGLMVELVTLFSDPGDLVVDPFAGGGTTGVACVRTGRSFRGCELSRTMATTAQERLDAEANLSTLDAHKRNQMPLFGVAS